MSVQTTAETARYQSLPRLPSKGIATSEVRTAPVVPMMPVGDVRVGLRHRRDLGALDGLAASIAELGLLHPIVITPDGVLIAGERRLGAAKLLGWRDIPVTIVDIDSVVRGEHAENTHRKDFTLSEAVAIKRALEPLERAAAKERQREGGRRGGQGSGKLPEASKGNAADKAARATGMSRRNLEKAEDIVDAAEAEPEKYGKLKADMYKSGRVNGIHRRLKIARQAEIIRSEPPPLPGNGPYRVVVIDFPWAYEVRQEDPSQRGARPYPTMNIEQICDFSRRLSPLLHADSIIWLWCTNFYLIRYAAPVIDALGVSERSILTWVKNKFGTGDWLRSRTEHCVMAVRGKATVTLTNEDTALFAPSRSHSAKPKEFYDLVERLCPAPRYADFFSRYQHNDRWDCHGDEAPSQEPTKLAECSP